MARAIFQHELTDPDFAWLLSTFREGHPDYVSVESYGIPVVLFHLKDTEYHKSMLPMLPNEAEEAELKDTSD